MYIVYSMYTHYMYIYISYTYIYIYICVFTFARAREGDYQRGLVAISAFIRAVKDEKARKLCFFSDGLQWAFAAWSKSLWFMTPLIAALIALFLQFAILPLDLIVGWCLTRRMQLSFQGHSKLTQSVNFVECFGTTIQLEQHHGQAVRVLHSLQAYYDEFFPVKSMAAANTAFLLQARGSQVCQCSIVSVL